MIMGTLFMAVTAHAYGDTFNKRGWDFNCNPGRSATLELKAYGEGTANLTWYSYKGSSHGAEIRQQEYALPVTEDIQAPWAEGHVDVYLIAKVGPGEKWGDIKSEPAAFDQRTMVTCSAQP
jgi:hypothetical protein